ncbi:metallophosphoesterase [uncultured Arcticibacterium sp.]|uniref:metallophosphoesterase family protein n=1 Tax=uncultured Arcticibacterium sp. TaxID=2173042 RepID=UPI0030F528B9
MKKPPVRVHHILLSQWQSNINENATVFFSEKPELLQKILDANDAFVQHAEEISDYPFTSSPILAKDFPESEIPLEKLPHKALKALLEHSFLKTYFFKTKPEGADDYMTPQSQQGSQGGSYQAQASSTDGYPDRPYSDEAWAEFIGSTVANYEYSSIAHPSGRDYASWKNHSISSFGVIPWQIPQGSKVAIIGDWGTGMDDSKAMLNDLIVNHNPAAIIHLGDIYYSGTSTECRNNFTNIINEVYQANNVNIPFFTIPGNHEYYSYGYPYFELLPGLNASLGSSYLQVASFFCLRVQNSQWQFLAMDTGYNDFDPYNAINTTVQGPKLRSSEIEWHKDKLDNFDGSTILLSHHQLFSANAKINGTLSWDGIWHTEYKNMGLHDTFQPYFKDKIAAWVWGHEHNFALYQNNLDGLAKGRLLGCSSYQESHGDDPYKVNCSDFPYLDPSRYQLSYENGYYNHAYGILDFSGVNNSNDPVAASYYEFPSWGSDSQKPANPESTLIYSETYTRPQSLQQPKIEYGDVVKLKIDSNFLSGVSSNGKASLENYPQNLVFSGHSGSMKDSDQLYIQNISPLLGSNNYLKAHGSSSDLTYGSRSDAAIWVVKKLNGSSGDNIRYGDSIHFKSAAYNNLGMDKGNTNPSHLNLSNSSSTYISFNIYSGISVPSSQPFPDGSKVRLAVAFEGNWFYVGPSDSTGASGISMHDIVANGGTGDYSLGVHNNTGGVTSIRTGGITVNIPRLLTNNDLVYLQTLNDINVGSGLYLTISGTNDLTASYKKGIESGSYFFVEKLDTTNGNYVYQNDLIYLRSGDGNYLGIVISNGKAYLASSESPVLCKFDYQEVGF